MRILVSYYQKYVFGNQTIHIPQEVKNFSDECMEEINVVGRFIKDMYIKGSNNDMVDFKEMFSTFKLWEAESETNGFKHTPKWFKDQLKFNSLEKSKDRVKSGVLRDCYVVTKLKVNKEAFTRIHNTGCMIEDDDDLDSHK